MSEPNEPDGSAEIDHMDEVDVNPNVHRATEEDEEEILTELYGPPDEDGIHRGEGV
ncbi:MAG TPA: hypothetical protein VHJ17_00235 [Thermomonospora sp.]|nr:hypothetical protein [Thermomonospora sp.]